MKKGILAKKIGMTQIFTEDGNLVPVTVLQAGPCYVTQKKTIELDGYEAIQVGFEDLVKRKKIYKINNENTKTTSKKYVIDFSRPVKGHFEKSKVTPKKFLREFRLENINEYELGDEIKADIFAAGDRVDVIGISKGKGFQGPIKRHGFARGGRTHGSRYHRRVGALSGATTPGKVRKGRKMPGHMGSVRVTVQNLTVVKTDAEKNVILIKGSVPGAKGSLIMIKNTVK